MLLAQEPRLLLVDEPAAGMTLAPADVLVERIDKEFTGSPDQQLQLRITVGDAYRNRGEMVAAMPLAGWQQAFDPLLTPEQITFHMRQVARNHVLGEAEARKKVTVIIRADRDALFTHIHKTMLAIKGAGFEKLQLRAEIGGNK